ncbi:MAG: sugar transferase [Rikenellaceae bacterium]|nr:sugar transferase [Rikenellaceae bacterium]
MYRKVYKRLLDLAVCIPAFIILLPALLLISLISMVSFGSCNVIFIQNRVGYKGREFKIYKFKTMSDERDANGELLPDELRETRWGKFMRRCSLDELLQLINIIIGDMSMIGPRPMMERYVADCDANQRRRFEVKPGVTGLAQVLGRNSLTYNERFKYDVWYVTHLNFRLDMHILVMTAKVVFGGTGTAYNPDIEKKYRASQQYGTRPLQQPTSLNEYGELRRSNNM